MDFVIRKAQKRDYPAVAEIIRQVQALHVGWRPDLYKPSDCPMTEERYAETLQKNLVFVAEHDGRAVGFMEAMLRHVENPIQVTRNTLYIDTMAVEEHFRGQGIGHLFFEQARKLREEMGLDGIELQVNSRNAAALEMYRKCGFSVKTYTMELTDA